MRSQLLAYVLAQVGGAIAAAAVLYVIASGKAGFDLAGGFASNGYGDHSPGGYTLLACLAAEVVLTLLKPRRSGVQPRLWSLARERKCLLPGAAARPRRVA